MEKTKKIFELLIISSLTIGCATIKHESIRPIDKLNKGDFIELNGLYSNKPDEGKGEELWPQFTGNYQLRTLWENLNQDQLGSSYDRDKQTVSIEFLTPKKAIFRLYQGDSLINEKKVKVSSKTAISIKDHSFSQYP